MNYCHKKIYHSNNIMYYVNILIINKTIILQQLTYIFAVNSIIVSIRKTKLCEENAIIPQWNCTSWYKRSENVTFTNCLEQFGFHRRLKPCVYIFVGRSSACDLGFYKHSATLRLASVVATPLRVYDVFWTL